MVTWLTKQKNAVSKTYLTKIKINNYKCIVVTLLNYLYIFLETFDDTVKYPSNLYHWKKHKFNKNSYKKVTFSYIILLNCSNVNIQNCTVKYRAVKYYTFLGHYPISNAISKVTAQKFSRHKKRLFGRDTNSTQSDLTFTLFVIDLTTPMDTLHV